MADFTIRGDHVNVEQIMRQIRMRIKEKRGVDYTEEEIRELANVKLEKFLDPRVIRSGLVEEFRRQRAMGPDENFDFDEMTIYDSHRAPILRRIRRALNPVLKLFFNPNPIIQALHKQSKLNARRHDELQFEILNNLVLELTRLGVEVKNLRMQVEAMSARQEFNERRARALEGLVQSGLDEEPPAADAAEPAGVETTEGEGRPKRRRRRRGRRRPEAGPSTRVESAPEFSSPADTEGEESPSSGPDTDQ